MFQHAWVFTEAGWTLTGGSADVDDKGKQDFFVLSHTCPGVPDNGDNGDNGDDNGDNGDDNGDNGDDNGDDGDNGDDKETPKPAVPTDVPAGLGDSGGSNAAGTIGLLAVAAGMMAGIAVLVRRRFVEDN